MFCSECGNQMDEGTAFCPKCGTPVQGTAAAPVQQLLQNQQPQYQQAMPQQAYQAPPVPASTTGGFVVEQNKKSEPLHRSGLLLAAVIVGFAVWAGVIIGLSIYEVIYPNTQIDRESEVNKAAPISAVPIFISFVTLAIPAVLALLARGKNNAKLALAAAILYILPFGIPFGIPSAILCFIGRAKLKKQQA